MECEKLSKKGLKGLLLLKNSGQIGQQCTISARSASMSCVRRTRCSWVSSHNASKRSVSESTGSSRSGEGLEGAASVGGCGGGGGG